MITCRKFHNLTFCRSNQIIDIPDIHLREPLPSRETDQIVHIQLLATQGSKGQFHSIELLYIEY